jgi:hypothetical protein
VPTAPPPVGAGVTAVGFDGFTAVPPGDSDSPTALAPPGGGVGPTFTIGAGAPALVGAGATATLAVGVVPGAAVLAGEVPDGAGDGLARSADGVPNGDACVAVLPRPGTVPAAGVPEGAPTAVELVALAVGVTGDPRAPPVAAPGPGPAEVAGAVVVGAAPAGAVDVVVPLT